LKFTVRYGGIIVVSVILLYLYLLIFYRIVSNTGVAALLVATALNTNFLFGYMSSENQIRIIVFNSGTRGTSPMYSLISHDAQTNTSLFYRSSSVISGSYP